MMSNVAKNWHSSNLERPIYYNYFDSLTKLFSGFYLAKFLDTSSKIVQYQHMYVMYIHIYIYYICNNIYLYVRILYRV